MVAELQTRMLPGRLRVSTFLYLLLIIPFKEEVTAAASASNLSYINKYKEISAVVHTVGHIPCSVPSFSDVSMILWFKDSSGSPIYSYDARYEGEPRHLTLKNEWGLRLYFRVWPSARRSPALMIRDLQPGDGGLYRCRVDYRNSPTANSVVRLKIIEPPERLEVRDTSQFRPISDQQMVSAGHHSDPSLNDITYLGPYVEGQNVTVVCTAYGGKPPPRVVWLENGALVDSSYESTRSHYVANELTIVQLNKQHRHDLYTCQASNHNETKAISHRINLDVYLTAKHIELEIPGEMTAGVEYNLVCKTAGAYPSVRMEFWKAPGRLGPKFQTKSDADNIASHSIEFTPVPEDDESVVFCRAENPWIHGTQLEAKKKIHVVYTPVVILRLGSSKRGNFSEGESVLFECHIKSNPSVREIRWYHQDKRLTGNRSLGVVIKGFTLQLTHLTHLSSGRYTCEGFNDVGKGASNSVSILINVAPRCSTQHGSAEQTVALSPGEARLLKCNIVAWPPDVSFFWSLRRNGIVVAIPSLGNRYILSADTKKTAEGMTSITESLETYENTTGLATAELTMKQVNVTTETVTEIPAAEFVFPKTDFPNGSDVVRVKRKSSLGRTSETLHHQSVLTYEILSEEDYGTVACWARNSFGEQLRPCLFYISTPEIGAEEEEDPEPSQSNDQGIRMTEEEEEGKEKVMTNLAIVEKDEEDPLWYKLLGTLGITIIWMGVLIFIGGLLACYCYYCSRRKVVKGEGADVQSTQPAASSTTTSFEAMEKMTSPPSPSIHNVCKISKAVDDFATLSSHEVGDDPPTAPSLLFPHSNKTDTARVSLPVSIDDGKEANVEDVGIHKHSTLVNPNISPCPNDSRLHVSIIQL